MLNKKSENIYGKYNDKYKNEIGDLLNIQHDDEQNTSIENIFTPEGMFTLKAFTSIDPYFKYANGYAGFDLSVIKYNSYHLLFWYKVLTDESTTKKEKEIACCEIPVFFYHWIGAFYSLKEKLISFVGAKNDNGKIIFINTCLSMIGRKNILCVFDKYSELINIYRIRNCIIHDSYEMKYFPEESIMKILNFGFSLKSEKEKAKTNFTFKIDINNIVNMNTLVINLLNDYTEIIVNIENIDLLTFKAKYTNESGVFGMTI